jgi:hypothetical protein
MIIETETLTDPSVIRLLCNTAIIFGAEAEVSDDTLWVRGSGLKTHKRQLIISVEQYEFDQVMLSASLIDENLGQSVYAVLGHVSTIEKSAFVIISNWLVERLMDGDGSSIKIYE